MPRVSRVTKRRMSRQRGRRRTSKNHTPRNILRDSQYDRYESPDPPLINIKEEICLLEPRVVLNRLDITFCCDCYQIFSDQTALNHHRLSEPCYKKNGHSNTKDGAYLQYGIAKVQKTEPQNEPLLLCGDADASLNHFTTYHQHQKDCWVCLMKAEDFNYKRGIHMNSVHRLPRASAYCQICGVMCGDEFVKYHIAAVHSNIKRTLRCKSCKQIFRNECALSVHGSYQHGKMPEWAVVRRKKKKTHKTNLDVPLESVQYKNAINNEMNPPQNTNVVMGTFPTDEDTAIIEPAYLVLAPVTQPTPSHLNASTSAPVYSFQNANPTSLLTTKENAALTQVEIEIKIEDTCDVSNTNINYSANVVKLSPPHAVEVKSETDSQLTGCQDGPVPVAMYCTPNLDISNNSILEQGMCRNEFITDEILPTQCEIKPEARTLQNINERMSDDERRLDARIARDFKRLFGFDEEDVIMMNHFVVNNSKDCEIPKQKKTTLRGKLNDWMDRRCANKELMEKAFKKDGKDCEIPKQKKTTLRGKLNDWMDRRCANKELMEKAFKKDGKDCEIPKQKKTTLRGKLSDWMDRRRANKELMEKAFKKNGKRPHKSVTDIDCICIVCCKTFKNDLKLKLHMLTHK